MKLKPNLQTILRIRIIKTIKSSLGSVILLFQQSLFNLLITILQNKFGIFWLIDIEPLDLLTIISCGLYFSFWSKNLDNLSMIFLLKSNHFGTKYLGPKLVKILFISFKSLWLFAQNMKLVVPFYYIGTHYHHWMLPFKRLFLKKLASIWIKDPNLI